jgi:abortive infection bacteriophage resistance protein
MSSRCQISANNQKLIPNKFNKNEIINPAALQNFVESLDSLRNLSAKNVSVMHIGDSHIEIGQFSGEIKRQLV